MPGGHAAMAPGGGRSGDSLPLRRHERRIVEKVRENRVTLIYATTGSGKSSQVPQMLSEAGLGPVLCTQPRRLAVVAVAKRVAEECGTTLGEDVGYQIGQLNVSTPRSSIVFKTAGVLLEEFRANGTDAISKYKVVILDEVHERSVESDLILTCLKQLLRTTNVKLVLMSATAEMLKYEEYFKEFHRDEGVEKIAIQNIAETLHGAILNTKVVYLEKVVKLLGNKLQHSLVLEELSQSPDLSENEVEIKELVHVLMRDLIVHLHHSEPDLSKNVLVFLPTYRSLERQWLLMKNTSEPFQVFALHSSIDMEQSLHAMEDCPRGQRKIILATNVAESSVTIPGVSFVIDSCRSLEIYWSRVTKKDRPRLVWVSESQANQRKGRTGRTCDGTVYRLVPRNQFLTFQKYETPAMQLLSLRKQVLMMLCASTKALNDPAVLFKRCINPPASETVQDALETLDEMGATHVDARGKHQATVYGQLLVSLPLSLEASALVIRGGRLGYLREAAMLATILDSTPNPILKPFGNTDLYNVNVSSYYKSSDNEQAQPSHPLVMLANLYAFEFWQKSFKDPQRMDLLIQQAKNAKLRIKGYHRSDPEVSETDWCAQHKLSLIALRSVAETADTVMEALHRFRPTFLSKMSGPPSYIMKHTGRHACSSVIQESEKPFDKDLYAVSKARRPQDHKGAGEVSNRFELTGSESNGSESNWQLIGTDQRHDNVSDKALKGGPSLEIAKSGGWDDWSFQESVQKFDEERFAASNGKGQKAGKQCSGITNGGDIHANGLLPLPRYGSGSAGSADTNAKQNCSDQSNRNCLAGTRTRSHFNVNGNDCHYNHDRDGSADQEGNSAGNGEIQAYNRTDDPLTCSSLPYTLSTTFHSEDVEKALSALVVEVQLGKHTPAVPDAVGQTLGDLMGAPVCNFFQRGICNKGDSCPYSHSPYAQRTPCKFFNTPVGCRYGSACNFMHNDPGRYVLPNTDGPVKFDDSPANAQSMLALLPDLLQSEYVLLFGEGDFSFAEALARYVDPECILVTSLDSKETFMNDPRLLERLQRLGQIIPKPPLWNVDVTSLVGSLESDKRLASDTLVRRIPWKQVRCAIWNFPFANIADDLARHQMLMSRFFASLSIIMLSLKLQPIPVIVTLCNDQFARWQVERIARNSFFFLKTSVPFDVNTFGGYCPMRNNLQTAFPWQRALIYEFELHPQCGRHRLDF